MDPEGQRRACKLKRGERVFQAQGKVCVRKQSPGKACYIQETTTIFQIFGKPTTENSTNETEKEIHILDCFECFAPFFFFLRTADFISRSPILILNFYLMSRSIRELSNSEQAKSRFSQKEIYIFWLNILFIIFDRLLG